MHDEPNEADLHRWLDGELTPEEAERVERYLDRNEAARARLSDYARNEEILRAAYMEGATDEPSPEIEALADRLGERLDSYRRRGRLGALFPALAACVTAFVAGAASYPAMEAYLPWRVPAVVETAARAHEILELANPIEMRAAESGELDDRVARHVGADVDVPDLASVGFRLVGGRLLSGVEGPLAQIVYEDAAGARLTLYVSGAETVEAEEITVVALDELTAGYWKAAQLAYSVVANMDAETLRQVAIEISAAADDPRS